MNVERINEHLVRGEVDAEGLFPHLEMLADSRFSFEVDFGLAELPREPGVLVIRGARQYGKSTWLERELRATIESFGPGTAYYSNGDELRDADALIESVRRLVPLFRRDAPVRRLFVDEITAIQGWEGAVKRLVDGGELRRVLLVTTGSRATDLRRGVERLPGRRGRLERTTWQFTPVPFAEFRRVCGAVLGEDAVIAYLIAGGCPAACAAIAAEGRLPEFTAEMVRDWVYGECAASGRERASLVASLGCILARGGSPIGQTGLAREAGLANNTVAAGYVELLADLLCVGIQSAWDPSRDIEVLRRPAKFPMINLLAATAWDRSRIRSVAEFRALPASEQGRWWEWLVAQELCRRAAIAGAEFPERLRYWSSDRNEIDFVLDARTFVEVKRGRADLRDLSWFPRVFPDGRLLVVGAERFDAGAIRGMTIEDFLCEGVGS